MQSVWLNFATPTSIYDNTINRCVGRFCHVEISLNIDIGHLRVLVDECISDAYSPTICKNVMANTLDMKGIQTVAFYILFGDVVSIRFLSEEHDDLFYQPIQKDIYESVEINMEEDKFFNVVTWNIKHLGRPYDIPRAILCVTPFSTQVIDNNPDRFFCSQMVMYMMKENNLATMENLNIDHMSPNDVYCWLTEVYKPSLLKQMDPTQAFGHAVSTGTQKYNNTRKPVDPSPSWNNYVSENYHAAKTSAPNLTHGQTMKSLGSGYKEQKSYSNTGK